MNEALNTISKSRGISPVRIISTPWFDENFCDPLQLTFLTLLSRLEDHSLHRLEYPKLNLSPHQKDTCNLRLERSRLLAQRVYYLFPNLLGMSEKVTELDVETFGIFHLPNLDWCRLPKLRIMIRRSSANSIIMMNIILSLGLKSLTHLSIEGIHFSSTPLKVLRCPNITSLRRIRRYLYFRL